MKKEISKKKARELKMCTTCYRELYLDHCVNCFAYYGTDRKKKHEVIYKRFDANYNMPVCKDCNFCSPSRGYFGCVLVPLYKLIKN